MVLVLVGLGIAACQIGSASTSPKRQEPATASPAPASVGSARLGLAWVPGQAFRAHVEQRLSQAPGDPYGGDGGSNLIALTAEQQLRVVQVESDLATLEVRTTSLHWQQSDSSRRLDQLPAPWRFQVARDGAIRSGHYWGLPEKPPLAGLDFFSAGLPAVAGRPVEGWTPVWTRVRDDDVPLSYDVRSRVASSDGYRLVVDSNVDYRLTQLRFTATGDRDHVEGQARAVVQSTFELSPARVLRTSYTTTYRRTESVQGATTASSGEVTTTIGFAY